MYKTNTFSIAPEWDNIEGAREEITKFLNENQLGRNSIDTIVMVISELLENSIKYGSYVRENSEIQVYLEISSTYIVVEVCNPIDESCLPHLEKMDRMIQWVRGYQDPFEAYVKRVQEVAQKPLNDPESGLGVVRMAYEGDAVLDFFLDDNDILKVSAVVSRN